MRGHKSQHFVGAPAAASLFGAAGVVGAGCGVYSVRSDFHVRAATKISAQDLAGYARGHVRTVSHENAADDVKLETGILRCVPVGASTP